MALSMDEQRALAEIERRLATDDPGLASCLTSFRRPSPAVMFRSPRARIVGSLFTVLLVAMISLMVYAMIPFRTHADRPVTDASTATSQGGTAITADPANSALPSSSQAPSAPQTSSRDQASGRPSTTISRGASAPSSAGIRSAGTGSASDSSASAATGSGAAASADKSDSALGPVGRSGTSLFAASGP